MGRMDVAEWCTDGGDAARDWMKEIPAIQKNTSAECQAALKALTYVDENVKFYQVLVKYKLGKYVFN